MLKNDSQLLQEFRGAPPDGMICTGRGLDSTSLAFCGRPWSLTFRFPAGWELQMVSEEIENEDGSAGGSTTAFRWRWKAGAWSAWDSPEPKHSYRTGELTNGGPLSHHAWRQHDGRIRLVLQGWGHGIWGPAAHPVMQVLLLPDSGFRLYPVRTFGGQPCD